VSKSNKVSKVLSKKDKVSKVRWFS